MHRPSIGCLALVLIFGCQDAAKVPTEREARIAGNRYLAEHLPQIDLKRYQVIVTDTGKTWRVVYDSTKAGTGGYMVLVIDKRTGEVVGGEMQQ